nr:hypothetical protein [uncultured bacterium]
MSAIGRLVAVGLLVVAFMLGMAGVVYMSLQGHEVQVPEITGKDMPESEKELASLGLKIKKRADRVSEEKPGTIIEQLPKPGETVKTGQMILVVTSKGPGENGEKPSSLKNADTDDTEKIEEMISDKPKKAKSNSNTGKKKADTSRDTNTASDTNSNSNSNSSDSNSNKKEPSTNNNSTEKKNSNTQATPNRLPNPSTKPGDKPKPEKKPEKKPGA